MELSLTFAVSWLALVAAGCLLTWSGPVRRWLARRRHPLLLAALVAVVARLVPSLGTLPPDALVRFDHESYRLVADAVMAHRNVYDLAAPGQPPRYPYLPFHLYLFAGAGWLAAHTGLPFVLVAKAPAIAADAALAVLVGSGARVLGRCREAPALAMAYALNPLAVLVTGYHGQFDAISTAAVLAAWLIVYRGCFWRTAALSALLLGLAVADKTWPVVLLPLLALTVRGRDARATLARRTVYLALAVAPVGVALAVYEALVSGGAMHALRTVRAYHGVDTWGISALAATLTGPGRQSMILARLDAAAPWLMLTAVAAGSLVALRLPPGPERPAVVIVAAYAAAVSWGWNWLLWLVPLALLSRGRWAPAYLAAGTVFVALVYLGFGGVRWGFVELTGTFGPLTVFSWAKLALWGAFVLGVMAAGGRGAAPVCRSRCRAAGGVARRTAGRR
jgi:hypothetical protein